VSSPAWPVRATAPGPGPSHAGVMLAARVFVVAVVVIVFAGIAASMFIVLVR
jgi:hypothetical protein